MAARVLWVVWYIHGGTYTYSSSGFSKHIALPLPTSRLLQDPSLAHRQAMSNSRKRRGTWHREFCGCVAFTAVHRILPWIIVGPCPTLGSAVAHGSESFVGVVHSRRYVHIQQWLVYETHRSASLESEIERPSTRYQPLDCSGILPWLIVRPCPTLGSAVAHGSESFVGVVHSRRYVYIQQW